MFRLRRFEQSSFHFDSHCAPQIHKATRIRLRSQLLFLALLAASISISINQALGSGPSILAPKQQQHSNNTNHRRPDSSSSFFADIEDLSDSSIKTRIANSHLLAAAATTISNLDESHDFDRLIEKILQPIEGRQVFSKQQQALVQGFNGHGSTVAADANNKTTMRFFRNNKTFASIVYTNEQIQAAPAQPFHNSYGQQQQQQFDNLDNRQPRRLINCHLVDLEKHATDVVLFESKYEIKTVDIQFNEMMQLIESCTNIARFKPFRPTTTQNKPNALQLFAASLPSQGQNHHATGKGSAKSAFSPLVVLGRPLVSVTTPTSQARYKRLYAAAEQASGGPKHKPLSLHLPHHSPKVQHAQHASGNGKLHQLQQAVELGAKKLVLGEVTPPPSVGEGRAGIKEALQEITSYDTTDLMAIWRGILPGTNWCGMGDRATSYNDLGFESDIDICCRAHDFCPIRLSAFSAGYGLFNWSFYTRSHCRCDQNFLDCLQRAQSPLSLVVLKFYFTIMKTTCLHDEDAWPPANQRNSQVTAPTPLSSPQVGVSRTLTAGTNEQQRLLLDQIRATMPIPALSQSKNVLTKIESRAPTKAMFNRRRRRRR